MKKNLVILLLLPWFFTKCETRYVKLENSVDHDIVLVNIEDGDREFIGKLLLKLDSLHPLVVGIDVTFQGRKRNDSMLVAALKKLDNDILVYNISQNGLIHGSDSAFTDLTAQGNLYYEEGMGLINTIVPLQKAAGKVHESFALKIVKQWKPDFVSNIKVDERVGIHYTRTLNKFFVIDGAELLSLNMADLDLSNRVFLVGYTGPGNEDKHFTPLRYVEGEYKRDEPDTYGLVIIANEIRTILEHKKK